MLKSARLKRGLTQKELSRLTGISQSYISKLERENYNFHSPTLKQIVRLAKELNLCPVTLSKWFLTFHISCSNECLTTYNIQICKKMIIIKKF